MRISDEFAEHEFTKFLEQDGYENVQGMLLHLVREAYVAGYNAAVSENSSKSVATENKISEKI